MGGLENNAEDGVRCTVTVWTPGRHKQQDCRGKRCRIISNSSKKIAAHDNSAHVLATSRLSGVCNLRLLDEATLLRTPR